MIVYKWVIKENNYYKPIINHGALINAYEIELPVYIKGNTIKNFIDVRKILGHRISKCDSKFHRKGFHFWKKPLLRDFEQYNRVMWQLQRTKINCTLKCYIRNKDIILQDNNKLIAKKFRILGEIK